MQVEFGYNFSGVADRFLRVAAPLNSLNVHAHYNLAVKIFSQDHAENWVAVVQEILNFGLVVD